MDTLIHADIFFFVSTIIFILLGIGACIAMVYVIRILRDVSEISAKVKQESMEIIDDVKNFRSEVKDKGFRFMNLFKFFGSMVLKKRRKQKKSEVKESE